MAHVGCHRLPSWQRLADRPAWGVHAVGVKAWGPDAGSKCLSYWVSRSRVDTQAGLALDVWEGRCGPGPRPPRRKRIRGRSSAACAHTRRVDTCPLHAG